MRFSTSLLVVALKTVGIFASVVRDADAECANLGGIMSLDGLPADVDVGAVRQCANGPSGSSDASDLEQRACWYGRDSGCSESGYCYKKCGEKDSGMAREADLFCCP